MTALRHASATDVGLVRANNQDRLLEADPLFAVADGMGGHAAGEVASAAAVEALAREFSERTPDGLAAAVRAANRAVWDQAQGNVELRGMGTTLVALALVGEPGAETLAVANVGDSRLYLLRQGELVQVTADHSLVAELVAEGQIDALEAETHPQRHVLTRALGVDPDVAVDLLTMGLNHGDRYLLCSDGLSREVGDDQLASVLRRLADPAEAARELVREAKAGGGSDNITVVVVDVVDDGDTSAMAAAALVGDHGGNVPSEGEEGVGKGGEEPTEPLGTEHAGARQGWRARRRSRRQAQPTARLLTVRLVGFFLLLVAILAVGAGGIAYYARESYFVGLDGSTVTIYQGRPGGVLWFRPTIAQRSGVTTAGILPVHLGELRSGKVEPTLVAAQGYVRRLHQEYLGAQAATQAPPVPTTPVPATTVAPSTVTPRTVTPRTVTPVTPPATAIAPATKTPSTTAPVGAG